LIRLGNRWLLTALRCLLPVLVSTPLQIVNRCCSGFLGSGRYNMNVSTLLTFVLLIVTAVAGAIAIIAVLGAAAI